MSENLNLKPITVSDSGGGDFEKPAEGTYLAKCIGIVDAGTHLESFQNYEPKPRRKGYLIWELVEDFDSGEKVLDSAGRKFTIIKPYTLSLSSQATLLKDLNAWRGTPFTKEEAKAFNIVNLVGKNCILSVVHNQVGESTYANMGSIMPTKREATTDTQLFSFAVSDPSQEVFDTLPKFIQEKINKSQELQSRPLAVPTPPNGEQQENPAQSAKDSLDEAPF